MTDKQFTTVGELGVFVSVKFEEVTNTLSKMETSLETKVSRDEYNAVQEANTSKFVALQERLDRAAATTRWAIGLVGVQFCALVAYVLTGGGTP